MAQPTPPYKPSRAAQSHTQPAAPQATKSAGEWQNNPFLVDVDGFTKMFTYAKTIAIIFLVLSILSALSNAAPNNPGRTADGEVKVSPQIESIGVEQVLVLAGVVSVFVIGFLLIAIFVTGVSDYAAHAVAQRRKVTLAEACKAVAARFPSYLLLQLLIFAKVLLWTLLFIVPGIIMALRYSLAGTSFFAQKLSPSESIQHSLKLTKDGWMTTFASFGVFNLVTLGVISGVTQPGIQGVLYRQFSAYDKAGIPKPGAHLLSILFTVLFGLLIGFILLGMLAFIGLSVIGFS